MPEYIVEPKSRKALRQLADMLRNKLGLSGELWIPIVELLDVLAEVFEDFSYEIVQILTFHPVYMPKQMYIQAISQ